MAIFEVLSIQPHSKLCNRTFHATFPNFYRQRLGYLNVNRTQPPAHGSWGGVLALGPRENPQTQPLFRANSLILVSWLSVTPCSRKGKNPSGILYRFAKGRNESAPTHPLTMIQSLKWSSGASRSRTVLTGGCFETIGYHHPGGTQRRWAHRTLGVSWRVWRRLSG